MKRISLLAVTLAASLSYGLAAPIGPLPRPTKVVDPAAYPPSDRTTAEWTCSLYGTDWTPFPAKSFETDKIIQDFSYAGYHRGDIPLPEVKLEGAINAVTAYGADPTGKSDSTQAIQNAIDQAVENGGGVVYLPKGLYQISPQGQADYCLLIRKSKIVLKGDGSGATYLLNTSTAMRNKQIISVTPPSTSEWSIEGKPITALTEDLMSPTTSIPVASTQGFAKGDYVVIRCKPTPDWIAEHHETDWVEKADKIGSILYLRKIEAVDAEHKRLVIDAPTRYYLKLRDHPVLYKKNGLLEEIGIEGLSIGNVQHPGMDGWKDGDFANPEKSAYNVHFSFAIKYNAVVNGWIRDVRSFQYEKNTSTCHLMSNGIRLRQCRGVTVKDCQFQRSQYGGGGGNGYMFRIDDCNECLIENCVADSTRHGYTISSMASSGNVLYRCVDKNTGRQTAGTGQETTGGQGSDHHMWFSHSNLYDTCVADNSWFEARYRFDDSRSSRHDITSAHTVFWNLEGKANAKRPFLVWSQQARYGYVIGTRGGMPDVCIEGSCPPERMDRTDPPDVIEGIGLGDRLKPFSLYEDQKRRRLGQ